MKVLRTPEAILMFSTPIVRIVTGFVARNFPKLNKRIYYGQVGKFMTNEQRRAEIVPKLFASFSKKENFKAFLKLNADLLNAIRRNNKRIPEFRKLNNKTLIIFGENDPYLNVNVAEKFHSLIPGSAKAIIKGAGHYVQVDAPGEVAEILIKSKNKPIATHY
jgi:pimeloyl-ACP methyl ester carboxylesterase